MTRRRGNFRRPFKTNILSWSSLDLAATHEYSQYSAVIWLHYITIGKSFEVLYGQDGKH